MRGGTARIAAPLAFLLAATIGILLIRSAIHAGDEAPAPTPVTETAPATTGATTAETTTQAETGTGGGTATEPSGEFYVVQEGDTLGSIAAEHDTTVEELLELNPGIDPVALTIGQRIRVG